MEILDSNARTDVFVTANHSIPGWATGTILADEARFLFGLIERLRPRKVLEIGVASGVSTGFISRAMRALVPGARLHAYDALTQFYANPRIACGAYLLEEFGAVPDNVELHLGISSLDIPAHEGNELFDFVFLDGNHNHPWPCLDLLSIIDLVEPGAWIALHDVRLPYVMPKFQDYGVTYLFDNWPGERMIAGTPDPNIGAIRLFEDREESLRAILDCLAIRWKAEISPANIDKVFRTLQSRHAEAAADFRRLSPGYRRNAVPGRGDLEIRNINPWTRFDGAPWNKGFVLHTNPQDSARLTAALRIDLPEEITRIVLPSIKGSANAASAVQLVVSVGGRIPAETTSPPFVFIRAEPRTIVARISGKPAKARVELEISLVREGSIRGGWLMFQPCYFA